MDKPHLRESNTEMVSSLRSWVRLHTALVTAILTVVAYALVIGTFALDVPIYPDLTHAQINGLTHAIAGINVLTICVLVLGWYWIKHNEVRKHRVAMVTAFTLILLFLVIYLIRVGGGGEKQITGVPSLVRSLYLGMLGIHIILSILAVPLVVYAFLLGVTHSIAELRQSIHPTIGKIAVSTWLLSLALGVITYLLLNHVYEYEFATVIFPILPGF